MTEPWLIVKQGDTALLVSFPHTGLSVPAECAAALVSFPLARHDADRHIDKLYAFATELGATTVHTALSRTVIDVNRDPSGASLYPGQTTTGLVPTETFDGRAALPRRPGAHAERDRTAQGGLFRAVSSRACRGDQTAARPASARGAVRLPLDPFDRAAAVFRRTSGIQYRHQCQARAAIPPWKRPWRTVAPRARGRMWSTGGLPAAGSPAPMADLPKASMPCRWSLRCAATFPNENDPPPWDPDFAKPIQRTLRGVLEDCLAFARG